MIKILLDTDIGGDIDDAMCLAYLLREPRCRLLGVTTVCGEPEKRAAVADAICRAAGREVPVVAGADETLQPVPVYPTPEGAGALERWPHGEFDRGDAPEFLYRHISENPGEARELFPKSSPLLQAVMDFGGAWLEGTGKLTLHDPLAAVSVVYPEVCSFERGRVEVETENRDNMGGTAFTPDSLGSVEIARSVDRERFYQVLRDTLCPAG